MCLAIPVQIIQCLDNQRALVTMGGIEKEVNTSLLEHVAIGDYVILHVGYALTKLDEQEAQKTLALFEQMLQGTNES
jgi:hydrogenase expression/formation protein HypC